MGQKIEFVERAARGEPVAALCREFGISRTTGHKWVRRFKERGYDGLEEESRRPRSTPLATAEDVVMAVLELRRAHPSWGPEKLVVLLRRRFGETAPSKRTVARILKRAQLVRKRRRPRPLSIVERAPQVQAEAPNEVWTVDFKGWWRARNQERCEPLTVRDAFSRFVLAVTLCPPKTEPVWDVFIRLFRRHGVPRAVQCDNGVPFVSVRSRAGLSALSAWWVANGITIVRSRPSCPQDNGAHERMHRDLAENVQRAPAADRRAQQRLLDRWRQEFNHVRPHQALGGKTPAEVYNGVPACSPPALPPRYPSWFHEATVGATGTFWMHGQRYFLSQSLRGLTVGLEPVDPVHVRAWFGGVDLGLVEIEPRVEETLYIQSKQRNAGG